MKNFRKLLVLFQNLKICLRTIFVIIDIDCKLYECIEEKHIKTKDIPNYVGPSLKKNIDFQ